MARRALWTLLVILLACEAVSVANSTYLCETVRRDMIQENPSLANEPQLQCGAEYSPTTNSSLSITISLSQCYSRNPGYQISDVNKLYQWIGPLSGFLVPALAFVISIPRKFRTPLWEEYFGHDFARSGSSAFIKLWNIFLSLAWLVVALL